MTKTWRNGKYTFLSERSQSEKAIDYDSNSMKFWKRESCEDSKKISGCHGLQIETGG